MNDDDRVWFVLARQRAVGIHCLFLLIYLFSSYLYCIFRGVDHYWVVISILYTYTCIINNWSSLPLPSLPHFQL
jgi:hypothetical protein